MVLQGWIEVALSNPVFTQQSNPDILIRSDGNDAKLIFGNTSNAGSTNITAGLYIHNNTIGVRKDPAIGVDLDVNGLIVSTNSKIASNMYVGFCNNPGFFELNGDFSFKSSNTANLLVKNSNNQIAFIYSNVERLKFSDGNGMYLNDNVYVSNEIYAQAFHMTSDSNFKENIVSSSSIADLETLKKLSVCDFNFKGSSKVVKGLIAQEVEKVYPQAITTVEQMDTIAQGWAEIHNDILEMDIFLDTDFVKPGDELVLGKDPNTKNFIRKVVDIQGIDIVLEKQPEQTYDIVSRIYIHGIIKKVKTIDPMQILSLCVSSIQELSKRVL
jgi:hypothetical protein